MICLFASDPGDRNTWLRAWIEIARQEPFAHPAFVEAFLRAGDQAVCLVDRSDCPQIVLPLILRPLALECWAASEKVFDLTSPYGYGGPYGKDVGSSEWAQFWLEYEEFATKERIVSTFLRIDLFAKPESLPPWEIEERGENVVVPLDPSKEELWMGYEHKVRKNVNTARRDGVGIEVDEGASSLECFQAVYASTMERRGAAQAYKFSTGFFRELLNGLSRNCVFFHARRDGQIVSSELVLLSDRRMYSFLGGTFADAFPSRPNDLLKHEAILWGKRTGREAFVLGGGYEPGDGIFRYKLAFSQGRVLPFRVACRVHSATEYARLMAARQDVERMNGSKWCPKLQFFPAYRG